MTSPQAEAFLQAGRSQSSARILLVDDCEGNLIAFEALLEGVEAVPVRARSAQEALAHLSKDEFALVILDVRMPGMGGFEVARLLRRQPRYKGLPIIFVTALDSTSEEIESAYALGAVDFLSKPIGPEAFRSKVRTFVDLYRSRRDLERRVGERTAELEATTARLRLFVDQSPTVQWMTDRDLRITMSEGAGLAAIGLKPGQLVGLRLEEVLAIGDPAFGPHRAALRGESARYESVYSGRQFECCVEPLRDAEGRVIGTIGVGFDRTERHRTEAALRESRAELRAELADVQLLQKVGMEMVREGDAQALFEGIMDAAVQIMRSQFASMQMLCDRGAGPELRLLGFRGFSREAAQFWEYVRPSSGCTCGVALRTGRRVIAPDVESCDFIAGTKDLDSYRQTGIRAVQTTPLYSREGTLVGMISTHWNQPHEPTERDLRLFDLLARQAADLIERRRAEDQLRSLNAELEGRVRERTQSLRETIRDLDSFAYTVAHDLRAPLRAVHSFGEMLLETAASKLNDSELEYIASMIRAGGRMDALITDLLAYARLTRQDVSLQELELGPVVDLVLGELREELATRRAEVNVTRPLPKVLADPVLLKQALSNLVSNAAKFVPSGCQPRIRIGADNGRDRVRLWVEDNGIGIDPQFQGKLFKVFERLNPGSQFPGTGIGLAIVRRAAERMSGVAGVQSEEGKGSRFWLDLGCGGHRA